MEIIDKPISNVDYDYLAERIFEESIRILGGLKNLINYRNLTWLPSLAEAAYAIVLKEKAMKTYKEIAEYLGVTEQTVKKIFQADPEAVKKYLEGEIDKVDYHKAGGIAKLAYERVKDENGVFVKEEEMEVLGVEWAVKVLQRIRGTDFPVNKETLANKLSGIVIKNIRISEILEKLKYPIASPKDLLHEIRSVIT